MNTQIKYEKYERLINCFAWKYSKGYKIDFQEVKSRANEIFCEALQSYESGKCEFSTHLTWQLKQLNGYCKAEKKHCLPEYLDNVPGNLDSEFFLKDFPKVLKPEEKRILFAICEGRGSRSVDFGLHRRHKTWLSLKRKYREYSKI